MTIMFSFNQSLCLLLASIYFFSLQCQVTSEHCSRKQWILAPIEVFECPFGNFTRDHEFCCGTILQRTCCTLQEKRYDEDRYASTSRAILSVIVSGITLIFIGFTIGWIYSCYMITRTTDELPEIDANGQPINPNLQNPNPNSFLLAIGRYLNFTGIDFNRNPTTSSIFAISPLNDKPPPYSSLFICDRSCSTSGCESIPEVITDKPVNSSSANNQRFSTKNAYEVNFGSDELPPPTYSNAIRLCDFRN